MTQPRPNLNDPRYDAYRSDPAFVRTFNNLLLTDASDNAFAVLTDMARAVKENDRATLRLAEWTLGHPRGLRWLLLATERVLWDAIFKVYDFVKKWPR